MRALLVATLVLAGCPRPVPAPPSDFTAVTGVPTCAPTAPTSADVCDDLFTVEGFACVRCAGAEGCLDLVDRVYCVAGSCLADRRCRLEPTVATDAGASGARRRR